MRTKKDRAPEQPNPEALFGSAGATLKVPESRKRAVAVKMNVIARQMRQRFDQFVEGDGLTRGKWSVIVAVARSPGATQRTIASMLEITEVTAGQLIDRLCADGYLERREHPKDRRAHCVHLTDKAQPLLGRLNEVARAHEDQTFVGLSDEDLEKFEAMLDVVARNLALSRCADEEKKAVALRSVNGG